MKGTQLAADIKFMLDYSKWIEEEGRNETWQDSVNRVMQMHRDNPKIQPAFKDPWFAEMFETVHKMYSDQDILGSNRAFQFGGAPIMKHNSKMYNCLASHCDRVAFFQEAMYWLMSGCGVGYSVQYRHIDKLPDIAKRTKGTKTFKPTDEIEGWADCYGVLMSSYFEGEVTFPEYQGYEVKFDLSGIRLKGTKISGGFKAPGPDGLRQSLERCEALIEARLKKGDTRLHSIDCYDIICHEGDAVLSGGVRRSASICVFSHWDTEMLEAKIAINYNLQKGINAQRARSNNSAVLVKHEVTWEIFSDIIQRTKDWGEPGFYFVDHPDQVPNPCVEIGMWPITINGKTGWQGCNLTVGNGRKIKSLVDFIKVSEGLAFLGTIQATYTDFKYVSKESKEIFDREALLGCGICGWMNSPETLLNEEYQQKAALAAVATNKRAAAILGIHQAARVTCSKPDGNTGVLFQAASGAGGEEDEYYFRLMQVNKDSEVAQYLKDVAPFIVEESVWSATERDYVIYIPVEAPKSSIFKKDIIGVKHLEIVKSIQQNWVEYGTNVDLCVQPFLRHNVSNTVQVENWEEVADYLFKNRQYFSGVSFLSVYGPLDYQQAPFTPIKMPDKLLASYGAAAIFASGLIVDGLHCFDNNLWIACEAVKNNSFKLNGDRRDVLLKKDWIRRAKQFAKRYFKGKVPQMLYCLKDVHLYHKWCEIERELKPIDLSKVILKPNYTDADTLGSASCVGGACELPSDWLAKKQNS